MHLYYINKFIMKKRRAFKNFIFKNRFAGVLSLFYSFKSILTNKKVLHWEASSKLDLNLMLFTGDPGVCSSNRYFNFEFLGSMLKCWRLSVIIWNGIMKLLLTEHVSYLITFYEAIFIFSIFTPDLFVFIFCCEARSQ